MKIACSSSLWRWACVIGGCWGRASQMKDEVASCWDRASYPAPDYRNDWRSRKTSHFNYSYFSDILLSYYNNVMYYIRSKVKKVCSLSRAHRLWRWARVGDDKHASSEVAGKCPCSPPLWQHVTLGKPAQNTRWLSCKAFQTSWSSFISRYFSSGHQTSYWFGRISL